MSYLDLKAKLQTKEDQTKANLRLRHERKAKMAALRKSPLSALANLPALPGSVRLPPGSGLSKSDPTAAAITGTAGAEVEGGGGAIALNPSMGAPPLSGSAGASLVLRSHRTPFRSVLCPLSQNAASSIDPAAAEAERFGQSLSMSRRLGMSMSRSRRPKSAGGNKDFGSKVNITQTLLGTGAFGAVYFATHTGTGQMIAVKKTNPVGNNRSKEAEEQLEQLASEIRLMEQLDHPNIVKYLHAERQEDQLLIYMELMSGSLAATAKKIGKVPESLMRVYMRQVLQGLCYLHQRNVVHRDLKADNILLSTDGTAKISDFGTSREFNDSANLLSVTGTPWFMAPEVVKGSEGTGHGTPADIWSIGCTMIELVQGKPPWWQHSNPVTVMYQIALHPEKIFDEIPKDLSPELRDMLVSAFQEDPSKRITAKQMLEHPFFDDSDDGSTTDGDAPEGTTAAATAGDTTGAAPTAESAKVQQQNRQAVQGGAGSSSAPLKPYPPGAQQGGVVAGSAAPGAVPAPLALHKLGQQQHGGSRPGTPEVGTPRSYATRLREETQGLQH